jgi:hypothetical protein
MSYTSVAYRRFSCEITWQNSIFSLLMMAKLSWTNHKTGRIAQNGGSRTATLDTSVGGELSAACFTGVTSVGMSMLEETTT